MKQLLAALLLTATLSVGAATAITINDEYFVVVIEHVKGMQTIVMVTAGDRDALEGTAEAKIDDFDNYVADSIGEGWTVLNHQAFVKWLDRGDE